MKKVITTVLCLILTITISPVVFASPSCFDCPNITVQPTGEKLTYYHIADEWWGYYLSEEGYAISKNKEGFWCYAIQGSNYIREVELPWGGTGLRGGYSYYASDSKYMIDPLPDEVWVGKREYREPTKRITSESDKHEMNELIIQEKEMMIIRKTDDLSPDIKDVIIVLRYLVDEETLTNEQIEKHDLCGGHITIINAIIMLQWIANFS